MIKKLLSIAVCACLHSVFAQTLPTSLPMVQEPTIITPVHKVYVSLSGNDSNSGSFNNPVKTIEAAFLKIPIPASGQHLYAEIVLLSGTYYRTAPIRQTMCNYRANGGYRNVSLRGIAPAVLDFSQVPYPDAAEKSCITLLGDHIYVKNLTIRAGNSTLLPPFANTLSFTYSGSYECSGVQYTKPRSTNILIDQVKVDSIYKHGLQVSNVDTVMIRNCTVKHSCLINQGKDIDGWPSAIKVRLCTHSTVKNNLAFENYGEGIISNRTAWSDVYDNTSYNNYSHNIYVDNGDKVKVHGNLCYNTDSAFWRNDTIAAYGVTISSEWYDANDWASLNEIYVYNNVLINSGKGLAWFKGRHDTLGIVTHSNIWLVYNTVIGVMGELNQTKERLRCLDLSTDLMKTGQISLANGNVFNNFFSIDPAMIGSGKPGEPAKGMVTATYGGLPTELHIGNNTWNISPVLSGSRTYPFNPSTDEIDAQLPLTVSLPSLSEIRPHQNYLGHAPFPLPFIIDDYDGMNRLGCYDNSGALINEECPSAYGISIVQEPPLIVFPNPGIVAETVHVGFEYPEMAYGLLLSVYNWQGEEVSGGLIGSKDGWDFTLLEKGWYFLKVTYTDKTGEFPQAILIVN